MYNPINPLPNLGYRNVRTGSRCLMGSLLVLGNGGMADIHGLLFRRAARYQTFPTYLINILQRLPNFCRLSTRGSWATYNKWQVYGGKGTCLHLNIQEPFFVFNYFFFSFSGGRAEHLPPTETIQPLQMKEVYSPKPPVPGLGHLHLTEKEKQKKTNSLTYARTQLSSSSRWIRNKLCTTQSINVSS